MKRLPAKLSALALGVVLALGAPTLAQAVQPAEPILVMQKVDQYGTLVPGGQFQGETCTRRDNELNWQCQSLTDFDWFSGAERVYVPEDEPFNSLNATGFNDRFITDIPFRGAWSEPIEMCMALREAVAPAGYEARSNPLAVCRGPGGWTVENAIEVDFSGFFQDDDDDPTNDVPFAPGLGDWTIDVIEGENGPVATVWSLVNTTTPTPTTLNKVDDQGAPLAGGTFEGESCMRFQDREWNCEVLGDAETALNGTGTAELFAEGASTPLLTQADMDALPEGHPYKADGVRIIPTDICVALRETVPPTGYNSGNDPAVVCQGPEGWTAAQAETVGFSAIAGEEEFAPGLGSWTIENELTADGSYAGSTWTLVNTPVEVPATPVAPPAEPIPTVTPSPTADASKPVLAATGADGALVPLGFIALLATAGGLLLRRRSTN